MLQYLVLLYPSLLVNAGAELQDNFVSGIIEEWQLRLPTIVVGDDLPGFCMSHERALCLTSLMDLDKLAEHLATLHINRKQDGVIFLGENNPQYSNSTNRRVTELIQ